MPIAITVKKGKKALGDKGQTLFSCCLNSSGKPPHCNDTCTRCSVKDCKRPLEYDSKFCNHHLKRMEHVVIAPSTIKAAGLGLFAHLPTAHRIVDSHPSSRALLFKNGDYITGYGGDIVSDRQIERMYQYKDSRGKYHASTIPYGLSIGEGRIVDSICNRRAGSYSNDPRGTRFRPNARLGTDAIYAIRDIYDGDEIFVDYGPHYWKGEKDVIDYKTHKVPNSGQCKRGEKVGQIFIK